MNEDLTNCINQICDFPTIYKTGNRSPRDIMKQSGYSPAWAFGQNKNSTWGVTYSGNGEMIEKYEYDDQFEACAKMVKMTLEHIRIMNLKEKP